MDKEIGKDLNYYGVYSCPVCRQGQISALPLMEAFACNFCRHIFTANLEKQVLKVADSQMPLTWHWNGCTWKRVQPEGVEIGWGYVVAGLAFVLIPPGLIGLSAYLFPPLPGSPLSWLPAVWTVLAFLSHLACLVWLILEYYQFPVGVYLRAISQRLFAPWQ